MCDHVIGVNLDCCADLFAETVLISIVNFASLFLFLVFKGLEFDCFFFDEFPLSILILQTFAKYTDPLRLGFKQPFKRYIIYQVT